eukprot:CAMPEP_0175805194 /NCGR_PEP_ID=MMETSP0107_2-20121207/525_1 /TAXON_ID=195067 ORGANISM="Goniomonas pacifica, Strain CCMP1869" /NCGR_SAMPLE_ID=MMETSP0107_2 /ASSEMBLY_ACC=CAM_ASM_000203 /LENGTH=48 /DNA_ID= /DNA_START= /DNA_END= /DNA_ORIENTATION=
MSDGEGHQHAVEQENDGLLQHASSGNFPLVEAHCKPPIDSRHAHGEQA